LLPDSDPFYLEAALKLNCNLAYLVSAFPRIAPTAGGTAVASGDTKYEAQLRRYFRLNNIQARAPSLLHFIDPSLFPTAVFPTAAPSSIMMESDDEDIVDDGAAIGSDADVEMGSEEASLSHGADADDSDEDGDENSDDERDVVDLDVHLATPMRASPSLSAEGSHEESDDDMSADAGRGAGDATPALFLRVTAPLRARARRLASIIAAPLSSTRRPSRLALPPPAAARAGRAARRTSVAR
jgi:hypothetical protein